MLNYFTTLGDQNDDNVGDGGCTAFRDRDDDGNSVNSGCDQRGAWDPQDLSRQQEKIVSAINALDADVVGLMEIENSAALGESADEATQTLVAALNADAGAGTWAANPSSAELPPAEDMDVITNAIIYKPAAVTRLGDARALGDQSEGSDPPAPTDEPFANAREPIAQAYTPTGDGAPFMVVVNHFKSKGSAGPFPGDTDQGDGQGAGNVSRVKQATALAEWIPTVQGDVDDVLLLGDFNSYTQEDPMHVLYDAGYVDLEEESGNEEYSYSFSGLSGSLDHVLANESVRGAVHRGGRVEHQRCRATADGVQPVQLPRDQLPPVRSVPLLRPRPRDRGARPHRRSGHPEGPRPAPATQGPGRQDEGGARCGGARQG